ncbi:MAG: hypothetical protein WD646_03245 [Actinomycetota bacterium]
MAKQTKEQKPVIRKSFLMVGGALVAVAILAFVLMNFIGGGGGSGDNNPPAAVTTTERSPAPDSEAQPEDATSGEQAEGLRPGGRDPFSPR